MKQVTEQEINAPIRIWDLRLLFRKAGNCQISKKQCADSATISLYHKREGKLHGMIQLLFN